MVWGKKTKKDMEQELEETKRRLAEMQGKAVEDTKQELEMINAHMVEKDAPKEKPKEDNLSMDDFAGEAVYKMQVLIKLEEIVTELKKINA